MRKVQTLSSISGLAVLAAVLMGSHAQSAEKKSAAKAAAKPAAAAAAVTTTEVYTIDPAVSQVQWLAKKVTGQHNGTISIKSGEISVDKGAVASGNVIVDMTTIKCLDITDAATNGKLVGHLNSDDFFAVEKNPTAAFKITEFKPIAEAKAGEPNYTAKGDLTIKGATHPLEFPVTASFDGKVAKASAKGIQVDRTLYDVRYGSGKFFQNLGNKAIDDKFTLDFEVTANKK